MAETTGGVTSWTPAQLDEAARVNHYEDLDGGDIEMTPVEMNELCAMLRHGAAALRTLEGLKLWMVGERDAASRTINLKGAPEPAVHAATGLHAAYRASLAKLEDVPVRTLEGQTWQDIASAPKDGTHVLTYEPAGVFSNGQRYFGGIMVAHWQRGDDLNAPSWSGIHPRSFPTHWMPLPVPPSAAPEGDR